MPGFSFQETDFFLPYRLGPTARDTVQEFIDIDVRADDLVRFLNRNQAYRDMAFRFVNRKTAKPDKARTKAPEQTAKAPEQTVTAEPPSPTYRVIHLLGMLGTRNLILALRFCRILDGRFPVGEEGAVELNAPDFLKRALAVEDFFVRNKLDYSETAYACALLFDLGEQILARKTPAKEIAPFAQKSWERGLRTGILASFLAERVPGTPLKQALAAGFLTQCGRLQLARSFPPGKGDYPGLDLALDSDAVLTPLARLIRERAAFGASQEELGAHSLRYFGIFPELIPVVRHHREPFCLKGHDKENYRFALLLWLASSMARSWKIPTDDKDAIFQEWTTPGLEALRIPKTVLIDIMKRAMSLR